MNRGQCFSFSIIHSVLFFFNKATQLLFQIKTDHYGPENPHLRPIYEVKSEKEQSTKAKYWKYYQPQRETRLQKTSTLICFNNSTNQCL